LRDWQAGRAGDESMMLTASIILCTCNRGEKLDASLASLAAQVVAPTTSFEVLVVDNNSTDTTREIAQGWVDRQPERFRYVFEPCQGKSHALNRGIREAVAPLLLILDDDCIAAPDWIQAMVDEFSAVPAYDIVGGRVELYDPADLPVTIRTYDDRREFVSTSQLFALIPGCNLGIRRTLLVRTGAFDPGLGPGSRYRLVAEDTDFLYRALRAGARMIYSPVPKVLHDHGRRTLAQVSALRRTYIQGRGALYCKHVLAGDGTALRMAYWELRGCMRAALHNPRDLPVQIGVCGLLAGGAWRWLLERVRRRGPCTCTNGAQSPGRDPAREI